MCVTKYCELQLVNCLKLYLSGKMWYDEKVSQYQLSEGADETTFKR